MNRHRTAPRAPDRANAPPQALARSELRIPRFSMPAPAAEWILAGIDTQAGWQAHIDRGTAPASRALDGVRVRLQAANTPAPLARSWNVAGLLRGSDARLRQETVLVTSHHDHLGVQNGKLYPGANDNASGVAAMLEAARLMVKNPPRRSVLFVAFGSEEQLMLGSYYYVAHPLRPLATTRAVLNLDMIGRNEEHTPESDGAYELTASRSDQLNLVGTPYSPDLLAILERESAGAGLSVSTKFDRDSSMRALFRCDHLPFLQKGIPAVWLFGGFHPGYHEPVDTVDRLDFAKMERVVRLTVASARALGSAADAPRFTHGTTAAESPAPSSGLNAASETRFADLALACVHKEYPNKIAHVLNGDQDVRAPRDLTPAFYGCYDWHSSVHGHWLLARLARRHPGAPFASPARAALARSLSAENIAGEVRYLKGAGRVSFERPYGLAWLLQLAAELEEWAAERPDDADVRQWSRAIVPLRDEAIARVREWLPKLTAPIRIGEHSQTAFSFGLMLDWARLAKQSDFENLLVSRSREFYLGDRACPLAYEPSGEDFLSPCLAEADLMRRVLPQAEFTRWLGEFLPFLPTDGGTGWLRPGVVTDPTDPKLGHLHGLNLSRAWMLRGIAASLPSTDPRRPSLDATADIHRRAGLAGVTGERYEGGHWLGTFAVYLETARGLPSRRPQ